MKKIFAIALVAVFVLGMAATAMAAHLEVTGDGAGMKFTGEYRFRAVSTNNTNDADDDTDDRDSYANQRVRLLIDAIVADDVQVKTRFTISDGNFNGAKSTGGKAATDSRGDSYSTIATDHAYLVMKNFGGTWYIGRQPASWGNKMMVWGATKDRIKYVASAGDITYGAFWQKDYESSPVIAGDNDEYSAFVVLKPADDQKVAIIVVSVNNNDNANLTDNVDASNQDGLVFDISYNGVAGPVTIAAEYASKDFDNMVDPETGFFVAGSMALNDTIGLSAAYAMASNGFLADDDFAPTLAVGGAVNATAIGQFGDAATTGADDTQSALVLGATMAMSDDLKLGANIAMHTLSDNDDTDAMEIDLYADYKLASNTMLSAGYMYMDVDATNADPITSAAAQIKTTF